MLDLSTFASEEFPLRISALTMLSSCPLATVIRSYKLLGEDGSGVPADTGSAIGRAIELWHAGDSLDEAFKRVTAEKGGAGLRSPKFPLANLSDVEQYLGLYAADARNAPAHAFDCERRVTLVLGDVHLVGHIDQVRQASDGVYEVWDLKAGRPAPDKIVPEYAWQQAAYTLGYHQTTGRPTRHGGIIRVRSYSQPSAGDPFLATGWSLDQCRAMLESALFMIKQIRTGAVPALPGAHCSYCPARDPARCLELPF